jgi:hypothetical protein
MKMSKEFDNILDECLERLLVKGETIEQCLQDYPEQADELAPLLQTALEIKEASAIQPRAEFKARARYQFHAAVQDDAARRSRPFFARLPRWATVVTVIVGLLLVGSGTVAAAGYSMPDSALYSLKLATENVRLTLTPSALGKAELTARLADRRVAEIIYMANKGDARRVEALTERLNKRLVMLASLAPCWGVDEQPEAMLTAPPKAAPSEEEALLSPREARDNGDVPVEADKRARLRGTVIRYAVNHPAALRAVLEKAPESAKQALRRAISVSESGYERALEALD